LNQASSGHPGLILLRQFSKNNSKMEKQLSVYQRVLAGVSNSYYGAMSMMILFGSCWGSVAAMLIFKNDAPIWELGLCIAITMANNAAAIGQAPVKWLVNIFTASVLVNAALILVNMF
jgi:hypothetical protein